jgi:hypothetical protein
MFEKEFGEMVQQYLQEHEMTDFVRLSENELAQLIFSHQTGGVSLTPQSGVKPSEIHFEVKRSLWRRYLFELILKNDQAAYNCFIKSQKAPLSKENFDSLAKKANKLTDDQKTTIRVSCILTLSNPAKEIFAEFISKDDLNDSEKFLTQAALVLENRNELLPGTKELSPLQRKLLKFCYWPDSHFRHMMFTEGGENMFLSLQKASQENSDFEELYKMWEGRWLTNLFGFNGNNLYYDNETHQIVTAIFKTLETCFSSAKGVGNPAAFFASAPQPLVSYLDWRNEQAGFKKISELESEEQLFLGHMAAFGNKVNILTPDIGAQVYIGYCQYREMAGKEVAKNYCEHFLRSVKQTPTYSPALLNAAYDILIDSQELKELLKTKNLTPLGAATLYCCQILEKLYHPSQDYQNIISCQEAADPKVLRSTILTEEWINNDFRLHISIEDNKIKVALKAEVAAILNL